MTDITGAVLNLNGNNGYGLYPSLRKFNGSWSNNYTTNFPLGVSLDHTYETTQNLFDSLIKPYNFRVDFTKDNPVSNTGITSSDPSTSEINLNKMYMDMDPSDALSLAWKKNPWGVSMGLGKGIFDTVGSIWNGIQQYRTAKQAMDLANKDYELKRQAYEASEARNQERFNWLRSARATSQL